MKKMSKQLLTALFVLVGLQANAALVKMGTLVSNDDGSTNVITDPATGVRYLSFDLVDELHLAGTLSGIGPGGAFEEFSIASVAQGDALMAAANGNDDLYGGAFRVNYKNGSMAWFDDYTDAVFNYVAKGIEGGAGKNMHLPWSGDDFSEMLIVLGIIVGLVGYWSVPRRHRRSLSQQSSPYLRWDSLVLD
jgi:hypothetical protein